MTNAVSLWWLLLVVIKMIHFIDANWITGNLCWSMPCMNGGSCFGSAYTYLCICPIGYNGALCERQFGICQENPCGNRGLCIEKSLTSFECRCYFNYIGPTCEEYVRKKNPNIWSSLSPAHTRILFDMLQAAYHAKAKEKPLVALNNGQIDFIELLSKPITPTPRTSTTIESTITTDQIETTETKLIIQAHEIQLDEIFSDTNTTSISDELTEQSSQFDDPNSFEPDMTSITIGNMTTIAADQIQSTTGSQEDDTMTEQLNIMVTSTSIQWSNDDNNIIDDITMQDLTEDTNDSTKSVVLNTVLPTDFTSSNIDATIDDDNISSSSDQTTTSSIIISKQLSSTNTTINSQILHSQLLYKLCQKIFSHILPNVSSSAAAAAAAVTSLSSNSTSINNNTADILLSWLNKYLSSSTSTTTVSTIPSIVINEMQTSTIPLQRIDMDDVLHQMNNYIDNEH